MNNPGAKKLLVGVSLFLLLSCSMAAGQAVISGPVMRTNPDPVYPDDAREAGLGGKVTVHLTVDKNGRSVVKMAYGPNAPCTNLADKRVESIRQAAVEASKKATFSPATIKGKPTEVDMVVTYNFDPSGNQPKEPITANSDPRVIDSGVLNGKALRLPSPAYPAEARATHASGTVTVSVEVGENGSVLFASASSGHPTLLAAAVYAACNAKFAPVLLKGTPAKVSGTITYNFHLGR